MKTLKNLQPYDKIYGICQILFHIKENDDSYRKKREKISVFREVACI